MSDCRIKLICQSGQSVGDGYQDCASQVSCCLSPLMFPFFYKKTPFFEPPGLMQIDLRFFWAGSKLLVSVSCLSSCCFCLLCKSKLKGFKDAMRDEINYFGKAILVSHLWLFLLLLPWMIKSFIFPSLISHAQIRLRYRNEKRSFSTIKNDLIKASEAFIVKFSTLYLFIATAR